MKKAFKAGLSIILVIVTVAFLFRANSTGAADETGQCSSATKDVSEDSTLATASFFANERNKPGSIKYESSSMLEKAEKNLSGGDKPEDLCPSGCRLAEKPDIVFKSIPNKFVTDYPDYDKCQELLNKTEKNPFSYNKQFSSMGEVEDWFADFSRGKGTDGEDLYKRCDGSCSPQYTFIITEEGNGLKLDASVVCGHERDKDDNRYRLSYSYRWTCESK
ncbi:MAG: hypothetical protein RIG61_05255 [Deltaproteobacteria bacterium]